MEETKRPRIAMVARTKGLEYDDRIRKECITLSKQADVKIYVNFTDNREEAGITSYGIPYESFKLKTRDNLPSSKYLFIKSIDFYLQVRKKLKDFDIIWAHEIDTYLFPLLGSKGKYIWDQHEIPARFLKPLLNKSFHIIEWKCLYMIHANQFRKDYLWEKGLIKKLSKHKIIRNYPDKIFIEAKSLTDQGGFSDFIKWLNGKEYVYLQGLSSDLRYPLNTVEAVLEETDLKVVIIGGYEKEAKKKLKNKYGIQLYERVYFRGMVDQLDTPMYIKKAKFSIVLYSLSTPNNRFCEPNRMYQAISLGVPVIVGCNKPMKELVEKYGFGVSLDHDGNDLNDLKINIRILNAKIGQFKKNIEINKSQIIWENQESKLLELIS